MTKEYKYKLTSYNASFSLKEYADRYIEKSNSSDDNISKIGKFFAPTFQRNIVWTDKKKSKLIETILIKLPVPPVFLYKHRAQHEIIDGYQRINAIHDFIKTDFKLVGLDSKYNNKRFRDLTEIEQADFETKMLNCIIIESIDDTTDTDALYEIFARLNSGGINLNNMEIRRAIGWGKLLSDIEKFNESEEWKHFWGDKKEERYGDIELILRILALSEVPFNKGMREYLDNYLEENKMQDKSKKLALLKNAIQLILNNYKPNKPFHRGTRVNFALADSILPVIMNNPEISNISDKLHKLLDIDTNKHYDNDKQREYCENFQSICFKGQGSISKKAINDRRKIAEEILLS